MAKPTYKTTHRRLASVNVGPVEIEGRVITTETVRFGDGTEKTITGPKWVVLETREGVAELWIDPQAVLRYYAKRALRSQSGVAKCVKGGIQVRITKVKRTKVQS